MDIIDNLVVIYIIDFCLSINRCLFSLKLEQIDINDTAEECQSIKCLNLQRQSQAGPIRVEMNNLFISSLIGKRHHLKP